MATPVIFRQIKVGCEIVAVFPTQPGSRAAYDCMSYMRIGQHGACSREWFLEDTKPCPNEDHKKLLSELENIGYDDLVIKKRWTAKHDTERWEND